MTNERAFQNFYGRFSLLAGMAFGVWLQTWGWFLYLLGVMVILTIIDMLRVMTQDEI